MLFAKLVRVLWLHALFNYSSSFLASKLGIRNEADIERISKSKGMYLACISTYHIYVQTNIESKSSSKKYLGMNNVEEIF